VFALERVQKTESIIPLLENYLAKVRTVHEQNLAYGHGAVYLPYAFARKYPTVGKEFNWEYIFFPEICQKIREAVKQEDIMLIPV